jgi:hypothetical protein
VPPSIESRLAKETETKTLEPVAVTQAVADNLTTYKPEQCPQHNLFLSKVSAHDSVANDANMLTLERRLREASRAMKHLAARAAYNDRLSKSMICNDSTLGAMADRFNRANSIMMTMPAVYVFYHRACKKYDEAHRASAKGAKCHQVATLIEQGLIDAEKTLCAIKMTLSSVKETMLPAASVNANE